MTADVVPGEELWLDDVDRLELLIEFECEYCGYRYYVTVGGVLLHDPAVIEFLRSHGVDVASKPHWEYEFATTNRTLTVRSRDPWEFGLTVTRGDATVEFIVDEQLDVVATGGGR